MIEQENVVLYHSPCHDGFTAAWVASKFLGHEKTKCIPMRYNVDYSIKDLIEDENNPIKVEDLAGKNFYIVDFSLSPIKGQRKIIQTANNTVLLDHHKTAFEEIGFISDYLDGKIKYDQFMDVCQKKYYMKLIESIEFAQLVEKKFYIELDNDHSGAGMAWNYFVGDKEIMPDVVRFVQDRDLWRWQYNETRPFMMNLMSLPTKMEVYDGLYDSFRTSEVCYSKFVNEGWAMCRLYDQYIDQLKGDFLKLIEIDGYKGLVINASPMFTSELGNALVEKVDFALIWGFSNRNNDVVVGLRSKSGGDCDVSKIAKAHFNGGGHYAASGGRTSLQHIQTIIEGGQNVRFRNI